MDEMVDEVRERLVDAVRLRLQADVPVGIYLSGGLDSSIVAGITTQLVRERGVKLGNLDIKDRITCFSISFTSDSQYNEYGEFPERFHVRNDVDDFRKTLQNAPRNGLI